MWRSTWPPALSFEAGSSASPGLSGARAAAACGARLDLSSPRGKPRRSRGYRGGSCGPPSRPRGPPAPQRNFLSDGPLIVQSDKTLLLEVDHPLAKDCRAAIAPFAELERSPEHVHTYRVTPLALWNARAAGHDAEQVVDALVRYSRYPVPHALLVDVADTMDRFGRPDPGQQPGARPGAHHVRPRGARGGHPLEAGRPHARRPDRPGLDRRPRLRARPAQAGAAEDRLAGRGPRRLRRRRRPTRSSWTSRTGTCATTSRRPSRASGPAARASSSCRVAPGRRWSAPRRWPRRRRPR